MGGNMNASKLAIPALCVGLLGVVGGVAVAQSFKPAQKPQQVRLVEPAGQTVTVPATTTTTTPAPTATATVKPVKVAVRSTPKVATTSVAPRTVQRQAVVSQTPTDPTVGTVVTNPDGSTSVDVKPGQVPPPIPPKLPSSPPPPPPNG